MPELMVDFIVSLDGCAAADGWPGLWGMGGPDYYAFLGEQEEHTMLMGATTYRLMSGMAEEEPEAIAQLAAMDKVVFSSTLTATRWTGRTPGSWPPTRSRPSAP